MEQSGNSALIARLDDHVRGTTLGGTGLSNPMKALTGIEKMAEGRESQWWLHRKRMPCPGSVILGKGVTAGYSECA